MYSTTSVRSLMLALLLICSVLATETCAQTSSTQAVAIQRTTRDISGWKLHIDTRLLQDQQEETEDAVKLLQQQLDQIVREIPSSVVKKLQQVPLYFSPVYPGEQPRAEFHPNAAWLSNHGRDPVMAEAIEFTNIATFAREMDRMPNFALHELAHAYHFRFLDNGFQNEALQAAFQRAKAGGRYQQVERWFGTGLPTKLERSYALTNPMEYFAESTEAYFVRNDFFPFTREELREHDPAMFELLEELWAE